MIQTLYWSGYGKQAIHHSLTQDTAALFSSISPSRHYANYTSYSCQKYPSWSAAGYEFHEVWTVSLQPCILIQSLYVSVHNWESDKSR